MSDFVVVADTGVVLRKSKMKRIDERTKKKLTDSDRAHKKT